jgi:hypothetical protein
MRLHDRAVFGDFWPHGRRDEDARAESVVSPISHGQRRAARCRNLPIPHRLRIDYPQVEEGMAKERATQSAI